MISSTPQQDPARESTAAVQAHGYTPGCELELVDVLQRAFGGRWGDRDFWRWKHLHRPGFHPQDVRVYRSGGKVIGCWHMTARLLRLGPGVEIPASLEGDYAMEPKWRGVGMGRDAASLKEVRALAERGIIARFGFTVPALYERLYRPKLGYRRIRAATAGYRKLVSDKAVRERLQHLAEQLRARTILGRLARQDPLLIGIEVSGFRACALIVDAVGSRCVVSADRPVDLALRLPYALATASTPSSAARAAIGALLTGRLRARHLGRFIRHIATSLT